MLYENGHEFVDLGLSIKWATMNIGAKTVEEPGDLFAWGEVETKEMYSWATYKWCNGTESTLTKYNANSDLGIIDKKSSLDIDDDVASVKWGGAWHTPSVEEMKELRDNCTWIWTTQNNVEGFKVISNKNGNNIFLPITGMYNYGQIVYRYERGSERGFYWTKSVDTFSNDNANALQIRASRETPVISTLNRYWGLAIRPVCP